MQFEFFIPLEILAIAGGVAGYLLAGFLAMLFFARLEGWTNKNTTADDCRLFGFSIIFWPLFASVLIGVRVLAGVDAIWHCFVRLFLPKE